MMETDLDNLGEHLVELLIDQLESGDDTNIQYVYQFDVDLGTVVGRHVQIYGLGYLSESPQTRKEDQFDCTYGVVVFERYSDPAQPTVAVPKDWIKERAEFVEQKVFNVLSDSRVMIDVTPGSTGNDYEYWSQFAEVTDYLNRMVLKQHKVFWSEMLFTFRKLKV